MTEILVTVAPGTDLHATRWNHGPIMRQGKPYRLVPVSLQQVFISLLDELRAR